MATSGSNPKPKPNTSTIEELFSHVSGKHSVEGNVAKSETLPIMRTYIQGIFKAAFGSNLEELSADDLLDLSRAILEEGNVAKYEEVMKMALSNDPENYRGMMHMSGWLLHTGQFAEALKFLERLRSKPCPLHPLEFCYARIVAFTMSATCFLMLGKPFEALGCLEPIASIKETEEHLANMQYYEGIEMLGLASFAVGRMDDVVKCEKKLFDHMGAAEYANRIPHLPSLYKQFVESLKYV